MNKQQEQLVALGAIFTAAIQADKLARTGQYDEGATGCLIKSLLETNPRTTLDVYGGDDYELLDGYRFICKFLERNAGISREVLRYSLSIILLERKLASTPAMLGTIATNLEQISSKVEHFGIFSDNVFSACGGLYEQTISTFNHRIQVMGDITYLQQPHIAAQIRTLLLTGIRSAMLWHQLGGRRWHLLLKRKSLLTDLLGRIHSQ